ncbi:helix-turn-helix transcriptional regulator [Pseudomaricurvus alcaniphilus]|uniref:helix-turn-helix transcriptional regulator n=1 Tax=Pseudomaricurvus alcaniphilus TaxID=1166482 RepID=UPI0014091A4C|nr:helix-turn-helix transcriptional regulator [Pseudomaricurvus alcaniphilus]NHN39573.1 helix-turn-helix transcriptional regulator [Pseudomaricurvus alcaniphilus]
MEHSQTISNLISEIYRAATDATRLHMVLDTIAHHIDADLGAIVLGDRVTREVSFMVVTPPETDDHPTYSQPTFDYNSFFRPWINTTLSRDPERVYGHTELDPHLSRLNGSKRLYDYYAVKQGASAYFHLKKSSYGFLSFCRKQGRGEFEPQQLATLHLLIPHIKQAFEINRYLDELTLLHDVTQERYQQFSIGIVLLNEAGKAVFTNPVAKQLLKTSGGISLSDGRLRSEREEETEKLNKLVARCIQTANIKGAVNDGFISISRNNLGKPPLSLSVSSYANKLDSRTVAASNGRALVVIFDPERRQNTQEYILERLYDLTATEAALATQLADGKTLTELALSNAVSRETLRSQLKRVFQKTHTKRQSELVKLVLTGPGSLVI